MRSSTKIPLQFLILIGRFQGFRCSEITIFSDQPINFHVFAKFLQCRCNHYQLTTIVNGHAGAVNGFIAQPGAFKLLGIQINNRFLKRPVQKIEVHLLTKPGSTLPLCRAIIDGKPLEEHLADVVDAKKLLLLATSALASHQNSERLIGAQLLIVVLRSDVQKDMEFGEYNLLFEPARKLWSICQTLDDASVWDFRVLVLETADRISLDGQDLDVAKTDWVKELAKRMINDPRAMPVTAKLEAFHTDRIYDHLVSRSTEILRGVYEGRAEFLASFEAPERKENERLPNAAEIYKRMQEAAAKLDDE